MTDRSVEQRLAAVERDLATLKRQMKKSNWITALRGTAKAIKLMRRLADWGRKFATLKQNNRLCICRTNPL